MKAEFDPSSIPLRESAARAPGLTAGGHRLLQRWFDELELTASGAHEERLVRQICGLLSGYMGIDPDILFPAVLATVRRERQRRTHIAREERAESR